jgi:ATP-dependent exoDNAse (exonuclease V) beta subunit
MSVIAFPGTDDAASRRAIIEDLDDTLVIEAAAGTGKTTELVNRILRVLETGRATMTQIVAVTFTEKAAGELKLRLRERLEQDRARARHDVVRARLEDALETLEEAHVNTIHGFCAELLRERPVEASVDPLFVVLTEPQAARLYDRAFGKWLQTALQNPPEAVRRALRRSSAPSFGGSDGGDGPVDRLRGAGRTLAEWRDFPQPWHRPPFDRAGEIKRLIGDLHKLAELSANPASERDNLYFDLDAVRRLSRQIKLEQQFEFEDLDGWEARLIDLVRDRGFSRTRKGSGYKYGRDVTRTAVLSARDSLFADLQQFKKDADADLAAALQQELAGATANYRQLKVAAGALDFTDLLSRARELLRRDESVRRHLQQKFTRIFVDEFQDTDPIQADILMLLAADDPLETDSGRVRPYAGKLFIVGDPKQAIYRFRGTDVGTYWRVAKQIEERGGRVLRLTKSYRSLPEIQRFVNAAFHHEMVRNELALQADYIPLSPARQEDESQPAIVALPVPEPYSRRGPLKASARAIEGSLPDAVGAFVAWLVDPKNGWQVTERHGDGPEVKVPLQPRHIAILFRRFVSFGEDVTRGYTNAIEARGVPHLLVGGKAFHGREEVETIRAALAAIEWPDDELSVFATLKGSLFAIDDEPLLEFRDRFGARYGGFHPFRIPRELGGNSGHDLELTAEPTAHLMPIAEALRLLQSLHRHRNYRPVADTITRLLAETRAHVGFILRPAGEQALANVLHVAELARQYEAAGGISFRGFIDELRTAADSESAEAPILEESSDGVRLMTVHKAKGLEFPVVILADLTCKLSRSDASRYLDAPNGLCAVRIGGWAPHELHQHGAEEVMRDEAEGVRLAYVAATRARDLLVVPAIGDEAWEGGWFSPLNRALYPPAESRRSATRAKGCPPFKSKDSVLQRPNDEPASSMTVCPGLHRFAENYGVVWWEPGAGGGLKLGEKPPFGVRREDLIVKDVPRTVIADGRTRYDSWKVARQEARDGGTVPSLSLATVREWTADPLHPIPADVDPQSIAIVNVSSGRPDGGERAGGAAFGVLVHAILAQAPFEASRQTLDDIAAREARILGLSELDTAAAVDVAERIFGHEVIGRARDASMRGLCRRESPIVCTLEDGTVVEGFVDLAFEEQGRWTVVDFKTDREIGAEGIERYRRQVALYASAIRRATGQDASGILLRI